MSVRHGSTVKIPWRVNSDKTPAKRGFRLAVAGTLVIVIFVVAIIGWSTGLTTWNARAITLSIQIPLLLLTFLVLRTPPPAWVSVVVPGISITLSVNFLGRAVLDVDPSTTTSSFGVALFFAVHSACAVIACRWAWRVVEAPPDLRAKGAEALRLLSVPLVLAVILAVLPDALGDELFAPLLSLLVDSSLVIVLGSGYTNAVSAREEWRKRESSSATSSVESATSDARPPRVGRWLRLAFFALVVGLRTIGSRRSP